MKRIIAFIASVVSLELMAATLNVWQTANGTNSGSWDDPAHWNQTHAPKDGEHAYIGKQASYTVTFPSGGVTTDTELEFLTFNADTVTLDGRNSSYAQTSADEDAPFQLCYTTSHVFLRFYQKPASPAGSHALTDLQDFLLTVKGSAEKDVVADFSQGSWNFLDPLSSAWTTIPQLHLFYGKLENGTMKMRFGPDSSVRFPHVYLQDGADANTLSFEGGTHLIGGNLQVPRQDLARYNKSQTVSLNVVSNATLTVSGLVTVGAEANGYGSATTDHAYRFGVGHGATLSLGSTFLQYGGGTFGLDLTEDASFSIASTFTLAGGADCKGTVTVDGASFTATGDYVYVGKDQARSSALFQTTNATVSIANALYVGGGAVNVNGGTLAVGGNLAIGTGSGTSSVDLNNTTATFSGNSIWIGLTAGGGGTLTVEGDSADVTFSKSLMAGVRSAGTVNLKGGTTKALNMSLGVVAASGTLNVSGGTLCTTETGASTVGIRVGEAAAATLSLTGGRIETRRIGGGNGTSTFFANGGTVRPLMATTTFMSGLTTAKLGAKGLTIDSDENVTIAQDFADADDAVGSGALILTGSGTKTLSGTAITVSKIIVEGGKLAFADGASATSEIIVRNGATLDLNGFSPRKLTVGDDGSYGILDLDVGETIAVTGDVDFRNVRLRLSGSYAVGDEKTLLTIGGTASTSTAGAWADALAVSGLADGAVHTFAQSGSALKMTSAAGSLTETQASGARTISSEYPIGANNRLLVDVSADAQLTLEGRIHAGGIDKVGEGRFDLANSGNELLLGISVADGLLSVPSAAALGFSSLGVGGFSLNGGTFEFTGSGAAESTAMPIVLGVAANCAAVVKTDSPLAVGAVSVTSGCLVKRGVGDFTIDPGPGTFTLSVSEGKTDGGQWAPRNRAEFDESGKAPADGFGGLSVAEGALVLKGTSETVFNAPNTTMIGLRTTGGAAQPKLVVDGAWANLGTSARINMGALLQAGDDVSEPELVLTNGAHLTTGTLIAGRNTDKEVTPVISVDGSVLECSNLYAGYNPKCLPQYTLVRGAALYAGTVLCYGPSWFDVTDSVFAKNAARDCVAVEFHNMGGEWLFGSGAVFCCKEIKAIGTITQNLFLLFNGGTWQTGGNDVFAIANAGKVTIQTLPDGGLTLPAAEGQTVRVAHPIIGEGSVIKTGAGTLRFETAETWNDDRTVMTKLAETETFAFTGVCEVREGALAFESGALADGGRIVAAAGTTVDFGAAAVSPVIGGSGTFRNGTCESLTLVPDIDAEGVTLSAPNLEGLSFAGRVRVDFGRDESEPLVLGKAYEVARYSGTAPDVSGWRVKNTGHSSVKGTFVAANGVVTVTVEPSGLILLVR